MARDRRGEITRRNHDETAEWLYRVTWRTEGCDHIPSDTEYAPSELGAKLIADRVLSAVLEKRDYDHAVIVTIDRFTFKENVQTAIL